MKTVKITNWEILNENGTYAPSEKKAILVGTNFVTKEPIESTQINDIKFDEGIYLITDDTKYLLGKAHRDFFSFINANHIQLTEYIK